MMEVKSVDVNNTDWCLIEFNAKTGKYYGAIQSGESTENLVEAYKKNWESCLPSAMAKVLMKHEDLVKIIKDQEKTGGNYYVKTPFLKTANTPADYESIFTTAEMKCDYTAQFYQNGECWPVIDRQSFSKNGTIRVCIKSEQALIGDFTYHFRAKPEGNEDIEIADGIAGSLANGELVKQIDLGKIDFSYHQDVELKIEHPQSGNSYLYLKVV
jgi:hypothetical protein